MTILLPHTFYPFQGYLANNRFLTRPWGNIQRIILFSLPSMTKQNLRQYLLHLPLPKWHHVYLISLSLSPKASSNECLLIATNFNASLPLAMPNLNTFLMLCPLYHGLQKHILLFSISIKDFCLTLYFSFFFSFCVGVLFYFEDIHYLKIMLWLNLILPCVYSSLVCCRFKKKNQTNPNIVRTLSLALGLEMCQDNAFYWRPVI